ncbi:hypothetical protein [Streptomyces sp. NPDC094472]|uniref:hypothetical protein n=1 Tax=Streptomyces sp. NPDC094472 TaxID=3155080 RepID=UPI0033168AA8
MSTIMTAPPPPRAYEGDSGPDLNEALLCAVRELGSTVPVECGADRQAAEDAQLVVSELIGKQVRCHVEKGCTCGPGCRCPHPIPPETALRPYASLEEDVKRWEREDDERGPEEEPEAAAFTREVRAAIDVIASGVLPYCGGLTHCGRDMIHEGDGRYVCAKPGCGATFDTGLAADPQLLPAEAADIGGGSCQECGQPVSTLNGRYACGACGYCN